MTSKQLTAIFLRLCEAPSTTAMEVVFQVLSVQCQRLTQNLISIVQRAIGVSLMHVNKTLLHLFRWDHVDLLHAQRLEDVLLEVFT